MCVFVRGPFGLSGRVVQCLNVSSCQRPLGSPRRVVQSMYILHSVSCHCIVKGGADICNPCQRYAQLGLWTAFTISWSRRRLLICCYLLQFLLSHLHVIHLSRIWCSYVKIILSINTLGLHFLRFLVSFLCHLAQLASYISLTLFSYFDEISFQILLSAQWESR